MKNVVQRVRRRAQVHHLKTAYAVSQHRSCAASGFGRASHRYVSWRDPSVKLQDRLKELAEVAVRHGYRRLHIHLQREGWRTNHKMFYRPYSEEELFHVDEDASPPTRVPVSQWPIPG